MSMDLDRASQRAIDAHVKEKVGDRLRAFIHQLPPFLRVLAIVFVIVAVGALISATYWEANNAGGGFKMLGKGVASPELAYIAGFGFTIAYLVFHRFTAEALREHTLKSSRVMKPAAAAIVFGLLSLSGVFANLVDNAQANKSLGFQQAEDRAVLVAEVRSLRAQVNSFSEIQMNAMLEADHRSYQAMLAEAAGWGMANLNPQGDCMADLKPRQRQLCNLVNGTDGLHASIVQGEAAMAAHETSKAALRAAELALAQAPAVERAEFWDTASKVVTEMGGKDEGSARTAETFLTLFMLAISIFTLLGTGIGWDAIFEYLERRGAKKETS